MPAEKTPLSTKMAQSAAQLMLDPLFSCAGFARHWLDPYSEGFEKLKAAKRQPDISLTPTMVRRPLTT